jgi:hypothetical protein
VAAPASAPAASAVADIAEPERGVGRRDTERLPVERATDTETLAQALGRQGPAAAGGSQRG